MPKRTQSALASARPRRALALASAVVTIAAFAATTAWLGRWQAPADEQARPPALVRDTAQPVPSPPPGSVAPPADARRSGQDLAARQAAVAAAAEAAEEAARAEVVAAVRDDLPLERRVQGYLAALRRALAATGDDGLLAYRSVWTEHFLRVDAVQRELAALSPGARASALARIRAEMGFAPEQIEAFAARDAEREARWEVGLRYMAERERLVATWEGAVLEEELAHLRERLFGHEARTIAREEADGFFRFERPRIYGRN